MMPHTLYAELGGTELVLTWNTDPLPTRLALIVLEGEVAKGEEQSVVLPRH